MTPRHLDALWVFGLWIATVYVVSWCAVRLAELRARMLEQELKEMEKSSWL